MRLDDALAAEPMSRLGAAAAKVVAETVELDANVAGQPLCRGGLAVGHPEEKHGDGKQWALLWGRARHGPVYGGV